MTRPKTRSDAEVLDAAGRVLRRLGPHAFTLADVAAEAGLSPATLLQRFGSKRGLLVAFARRASTSADRPFIEAALGGTPPLKALREALLEPWRGMGTRRQFANSLALLLEDVRDDTLRELAGGFFRRCEQAVAALLEDAMARGELERGDARRLARTLLCAWHGAVIQHTFRLEGSLGYWLDLVLADLLRPPAGQIRLPSRGARGKPRRR